MENRRFPPAWSVDDDKKLGQDCYVRDADGHALVDISLGLLAEETATATAGAPSLTTITFVNGNGDFVAVITLCDCHRRWRHSATAIASTVGGIIGNDTITQQWRPAAL